MGEVHHLICDTVLEYCIHLWSPQHRRDMDLFEAVQRNATKKIKAMKQL